METVDPLPKDGLPPLCNPLLPSILIPTEKKSMSTDITFPTRSSTKTKKGGLFGTHPSPFQAHALRKGTMFCLFRTIHNTAPRSLQKDGILQSNVSYHSIARKETKERGTGSTKLTSFSRSIHRFHVRSQIETRILPFLFHNPFERPKTLLPSIFDPTPPPPVMKKNHYRHTFCVCNPLRGRKNEGGRKKKTRGKGEGGGKEKIGVGENHHEKAVGRSEKQ